jgi:hypothetical protein
MLNIFVIWWIICKHEYLSIFPGHLTIKLGQPVFLDCWPHPSMCIYIKFNWLLFGIEFSKTSWLNCFADYKRLPYFSYSILYYFIALLFLWHQIQRRIFTKSIKQYDLVHVQKRVNNRRGAGILLAYWQSWRQ